MQRWVGGHGRHFPEQTGANPDGRRPQEPADSGACVRRVQEHAGVAGALFVVVEAQAGRQGEAFVHVVVELAETRFAFLRGTAFRVVGVVEEAGIEGRGEYRRRRDGGEIERIGQHVVAAEVVAAKAAGAEQEVQRAVEAGAELRFHGPEIRLGVPLVVAEDAILMGAEDAAAGDARGTV